MGASMAIHAPIARKRRGHALRARAVSVAVEEREVCCYEVRPCAHPHRQLRRKVICRIKIKNRPGASYLFLTLSWRNGGQQVGSGSRAVDSVALLGGVGDERLVQGSERAEELPGERRQILDNQVELRSK